MIFLLALSLAGAMGYQLCQNMHAGRFYMVYQALNVTHWEGVPLTAYRDACEAFGLEPAKVGAREVAGLHGLSHECFPDANVTYGSAWIGNFADLDAPFGCFYLSYQGGIFSDASVCHQRSLPAICQVPLHRVSVRNQGVTELTYHTRTLTVTEGDPAWTVTTLRHVTVVTSTLFADIEAVHTNTISQEVLKRAELPQQPHRKSSKDGDSLIPCNADVSSPFVLIQDSDHSLDSLIGQDVCAHFGWAWANMEDAADLAELRRLHGLCSVRLSAMHSWQGYRSPCALFYTEPVVNLTALWMLHVEGDVSLADCRNQEWTVCDRRRTVPQFRPEHDFRGWRPSHTDTITIVTTTRSIVRPLTQTSTQQETRTSTHLCVHSTRTCTHHASCLPSATVTRNCGCTTPTTTTIPTTEFPPFPPTADTSVSSTPTIPSRRRPMNRGDRLRGRGLQVARR